MTNQNVNFSQFTTDESWGSTWYPNFSGNNSGGGSLSSIASYSRASTIQRLLYSQNLNNITTPTMSMSQSSFNFSGLPPRGPSSSVWTSPNSMGVSDPILSVEAQQPCNTPNVVIWSDSKAVERFLMDDNEENNNEDPMGEMRSKIATGSSHLTGLPVDTGAVQMVNGGLESSKPPLSPAVSPTYGTNIASASERDKSKGKNRVSDLVSPKKFKKLLTNRESHARSKLRRLAYVAELEAEFTNVKAEHARLITKYDQLQEVSEKDRIALFNENRELKIRLEGMEKLNQQQAQLHHQQAEHHQALIQQLKARIDELNMNQLH